MYRQEPDQLFDMNKLMDKLLAFKFKKKPGLRLLLAFVILMLLFGSFYQIEAEEVGIVLRFGKYVRKTEPGLRLKFPLIESVTKVPVQRQLKEEFGFRSEEVGTRTRYSQGSFADEASMLSGDLNVAMVEWIVQYRIADPYNYLKAYSLD
jgi:membrane protease subunit HflK